MKRWPAPAPKPGPFYRLRYWWWLTTWKPRVTESCLHRGCLVEWSGSTLQAGVVMGEGMSRLERAVNRVQGYFDSGQLAPGAGVRTVLAAARAVVEGTRIQWCVEHGDNVNTFVSGLRWTRCRAARQIGVDDCVIVERVLLDPKELDDV